MVKFKRRSMACALGLATGLCACIGFAAPAEIKTASADYSAPQETTVESAETVAQQPATESPDAIGGVELLANDEKSIEIPFYDKYNRETGFVVFAKLIAKDYLWPNSDRGQVLFDVKYIPDRKETTEEINFNQYILVNAEIVYKWTESNGASVKWQVELRFNSPMTTTDTHVPSYEFYYDDYTDSEVWHPIQDKDENDIKYIYKMGMDSATAYTYDRTMNVGQWKKSVRGNQWACNNVTMTIEPFMFSSGFTASKQTLTAYF